MRIYVHSLALVCLLAVNSLAAEPPEIEPDGIIDEAFSEMVPLAGQVAAPEPLIPETLERVDAFIEGLNIHRLPPLTEDDIAEADRLAAEKFAHVSPGPARVGVVRQFEPGEVAVHLGAAKVIQADNGRSVWALAVRSPGAFGIRLHFVDFNVGDATVVVYAESRSGIVTRGPFTERGPERDGDFWTASLPGEEVFVEIVGREEPSLTIQEIVHFDQEIGSIAAGPPLLDCHEDVMCHLDLVDWGPVKATGQMNFHDTTSSYVCTGTLLSDLDWETIVPWFITAKHCLDTQEMIDTLEVVWNYETPSCNDEAGVPDWWTLPRNVGGRHFKRYGENDMEFMRLAGTLPGGLILVGWTEATSTGTYGVHHPKGSWKRMVDLTSATIGCPTFDPTDYDSYNRTNGLTQKGSSGSGVFNSAGQFTGQLWGVCSTTTDPDDLSCSNIDNFWNMYGEFDTSHDQIGWYLDIGGTMYVDPSSGCLIPQGTAACPALSIEQALGAAWPELRIKIEAGSYPAPLRIEQPVRLLAMNGDVMIGR